MATEKEKHTHIKQTIEENIAPELSAKNLDADTTTDTVEAHVTELKERLSTQIPTTQKTKQQEPKKSIFDFSALSKKITNLLGQQQTTKIILPTKKIQQKKVIKALENEVKKLVKEAHTIQNQKKFCPNKLETVIQKIRNLRKMLNEVMHIATNTLEQWYRKFVISQ